MRKTPLICSLLMAFGMSAIMIPDLVEPTEEIRALAWHVCRSLEEVGPLL